MRTSERRVGDAIPIPGDYQFQATFRGRAPQRFWHQTRMETCLEMLDLESGTRILDAGCGSGVFAAEVARCPGIRVMAVDGNPDAVAFARRQFRLPNLEFERALVDELPFEPSSFDRVACLEVIEHIHADQARSMLRTFHRLLSPDGRLVISTPNVHSYWPLLERGLDLLHLVPTMEQEQHVSGYHPRSLQELGEACGFRLVQSRTLFVLSPWVALGSWRWARALHELEQRGRARIGALLVQSFARC